MIVNFFGGINRNNIHVASRNVFSFYFDNHIALFTCLWRFFFFGGQIYNFPFLRFYLNLLL